MPPRKVRDEIKLYGTLLGLEETECEQMASGGSAKTKRECMRDLRRRYGQENAVAEGQRRLGPEQVEFWREVAPVERFVYFIQRGPWGAVKIGVTGDPLRRLSEFQTANSEELHIRHVVPGDEVLEKQLHHRFREARIRGEWFGQGEWSGRRYLEIILLYAEGLAASNIECFERDRTMPVIMSGSRVISMRQRSEMRLDLQRLLRRYGSDALFGNPEHSELFAIMRQSYGMGPDEVRAEIAGLPGLPSDYYGPFAA